MSENTVYISKVVEEDGIISMLLQPELLKELALVNDATYVWKRESNGSFSVMPLVKP